MSEIKPQGEQKDIDQQQLESVQADSVYLHQSSARAVESRDSSLFR